MKNTRNAIALLLSIAACLIPALAQDAPPAGTPTFRTGARMVLVPVGVRDREGRVRPPVRSAADPAMAGMSSQVEVR